MRALHHYDEIGVLAPSLRTSSGHRLYDAADVARLQQIQSLRAMGFSLDEVKRLLDGAALSARDVVALHLGRLHDEIARQTRLAERLTALAHHLDEAETPSPADLCHIIEAMTTMEKFFTTEQLETLRERRERVAESSGRTMLDDWSEIIGAVRDAMAQGVDPTAPEMLAVARRWQANVRALTGGDPALAQAVRTMYESEGPALQATLPAVPTPEMFAYMGRAFAVLGT